MTIPIPSLRLNLDGFVHVQILRATMPSASMYMQLNIIATETRHKGSWRVIIVIRSTFLTTGNRIKQDLGSVYNNITSNAIRDYMINSAYGVITFADIVATPVHHTTWPPFGLAASSFISTAAFLLSLGFYSSAVSVSQDIKLRRLILHYVEDRQQQIKFLNTIGTTQEEQEMESKVLAILNESSDLMKEESGIESSISEKELKEYLQLVLKETK